MARIWQNGFELEYGEYAKASRTLNFDNFTGISSGESSTYYGSIGIAKNTRGGLGTRCLKLGLGGANSWFSRSYATLTIDEKEQIYLRVWINPESNSLTYKCLSFEDSNNKVLFYVNLVKINDFDYKLLFYNYENTLMYEYLTLPYNTWVKLDIKFIVNSSGELQFKINDRLITTWIGNTKGTLGNIKHIRLGNTANTKGTYVIKYDDMAINDVTGTVNNSWCGNGSIINIHPYANGSVTDYEPLSGENWENVSETAPDGDTTINTSYAIGDTDLFKFKLPDGISDDTVINAIQVTVNARYTEQPMHIDNVVKIGEREITSDNTLTPVFSNYCMPIDMNPNTSAKFTAKELRDDVEIGYRTKDVPQEDV